MKGDIMSFDKLNLDRRAFLRGSALLFAAPTVMGLAACGGSKPAETDSAATDDAAATDATEAAFDGNLIVGFDQEFPPYGYVDDEGEYAGFDLDLAKAVCDAKGWTYTPTPIDWDAKDAMLNSGQITCIWNGFTIEGREKDYAFTSAYMNNSNVIVVAADSDIKTLADLAGKNVVVQTDSGAQSVLEGDQAELTATFGALETIGEYHTAFMMLEQGTYDAIAVDYGVPAFNIAGKEDKFTILEEPLNGEHYGVGFALGNEALAAEVEAQMQALYADGTVAKIAEKYADQGLSMDNWCLPEA